MSTNIYTTTELRYGDLVLDSGTSDVEHPLIFDQIVSVSEPKAGCVTVRVDVLRHAYGRIVTTHWWSGVEALHVVLAHWHERDEDVPVDRWSAVHPDRSWEHC